MGLFFVSRLKRTILLLIPILAISIAGCVSKASDSPFRKEMSERRVVNGMSDKEVKKSWGSPHKIIPLKDDRFIWYYGCILGNYPTENLGSLGEASIESFWKVRLVAGRVEEVTGCSLEEYSAISKK